MNDFKSRLSKLNQNLNILREREAKYGVNAPLELLNQISDHEQAIALTELALAGDLSEADWREATRPLLLALQDGQVVNYNITINQAPEEPPFWRRMSRANLILAIIGVIAAVLAIPGVGGYVYDVFSPPPFAPAAGDETLIVIATFYETAATKTEPHTKIRRAIEEAAQKAELDNLRVEEEPTVLKADERQQAETLGNLYNASIIIWGEDTGVQVLVNFLNLKQPDLEAAEVKINETERTQVANPDTYAHFIVSDLPGQLTFLSFFAVGQSFYQARNYSQAKQVIEQGVASLAANTQINGLAQAYFRLGWLYQIPLGDLTAAITNYSKAIELDPRNATVYNNRGNALDDRGDPAAAIADYSKAIELDPNYATVYNNRGITLKAQGDLAAAIADYNKAIELDPNYAKAYNNRGNALKAQGDPAAAIADYNKAIELDPKYAEAYNNRGNALDDRGDPAAAMADYNKAIELDPKYAPAYNNRGITLKAQGDLAAAIADYNKAIELDPNYAPAYNNRGNALDNQGDPAAAIADYSKAIELDPKYAEAYNNRGVAFYDQGDLAAAMADYNKAIELDPKYTLAYNNRGNALKAQGDLAAAMADYNKAIELDPNYATAYSNRGVAFYNQGNSTAALADYSKAIELDPKLAAAYYNTACVYAIQSQVEAALSPLRRALELDAARYLELIPSDPDFDKIRDDPRFKALLAEFG